MYFKNLLAFKFFKLLYFFSYLNELPLFQFAVMSLVRNEVICFFFLSSFIPLKTFTA